MREFIKKYWKLLIALFFIPLIITYVWFVFEGGVPTGSGLDKSHWLGFTGGFLAYIGTVFLGTVTLWQNDKVYEANNLLINLQNKSNEISIIQKIYESEKIKSQEVICIIDKAIEYSDFKHIRELTNYYFDTDSVRRINKHNTKVELTNFYKDFKEFSYNSYLFDNIYPSEIKEYIDSLCSILLANKVNFENNKSDFCYRNKYDNIQIKNGLLCAKDIYFKERNLLLDKIIFEDLTLEEVRTLIKENPYEQ